MTTQKKKFSDVKRMFQSFPNGLTLNEACAEFRRLYPQEVRDIAAYICGQTSHANFIKLGMKGDETVYTLHVPTKREKIVAKLNAAQKQMEQGRISLEKQQKKLAKLDLKKAVSADTFDFDPNNIKD